MPRRQLPGRDFAPPRSRSLSSAVLLTLPTSLTAKDEGFVAARDFDSVFGGGFHKLGLGFGGPGDCHRGRMASSGRGANRYETSSLIAAHGVAQGWATWKFVGVATGTNFPDALTGGVAVGKNAGILMVTTPDDLHPQIRARFEANRGTIVRVQLFGGAVALSENVANQIKQILQ